MQRPWQKQGRHANNETTTTTARALPADTSSMPSWPRMSVSSLCCDIRSAIFFFFFVVSFSRARGHCLANLTLSPIPRAASRREILPGNGPRPERCFANKILIAKRGKGTNRWDEDRSTMWPTLKKKKKKEMAENKNNETASWRRPRAHPRRAPTPRVSGQPYKGATHGSSSNPPIFLCVCSNHQPGSPRNQPFLPEEDEGNKRHNNKCRRSQAWPQPRTKRRNTQTDSAQQNKENRSHWLVRWRPYQQLLKCWGWHRNRTHDTTPAIACRHQAFGARQTEDHARKPGKKKSRWNKQKSCRHAQWRQPCLAHRRPLAAPNIPPNPTV